MSGKSHTHCRKGHEFTPENTISSGRNKQCRTCVNAWTRKNHKINNAERNAKIRKWHEDNQEKVTVSRRHTNWRSHGWSPETVEKALVIQNNCCAICGKEFVIKEGRKGPCADHAHTVPPKPRGMLCSYCNWGLGMFFDNPQLLREAALYLEKF